VIIGILGQMRSGKTTLARAILAEYDSRFIQGAKIYSFAEALRQECAELLWPNQNAQTARGWWTTLESQFKSEVRPLLQAVGQAKRRFNDADYWVNALALTIPADEEHLAIIDDVRHENEARWILENGGIIIRLHADRETLIKRGASEERLAHYSETAMIQRSQVEKEYAHRCLAMRTTGLSTSGVFKGLRRFIEELIWGEE